MTRLKWTFDGYYLVAGVDGWRCKVWNKITPTGTEWHWSMARDTLTVQQLPGGFAMAGDFETRSGKTTSRSRAKRLVKEQVGTP